ncbi:MAG: hypothetical protein NT077_04690 [Candidatus Taylorbacteria bacterium]|nr:hypothetical protein [Candidatus Taylorbacteria bacterium]
MIETYSVAQYVLFPYVLQVEAKTVVEPNKAIPKKNKKTINPNMIFLV